MIEEWSSDKVARQGMECRGGSAEEIVVRVQKKLRLYTNAVCPTPCRSEERFFFYFEITLPILDKNSWKVRSSV
jgi:hypothetical protein